MISLFSVIDMRFYIFPIFSLILICGANSAIAQSITAADGKTTVTPVGSRSDITGNQVSGINQFHNFTNFNVGTGATANFIRSNPNITNILSRVTGGTSSQIQGVIQSANGVNLFLMNPAGILFGNGASLNVPGSFTATTANAIGGFDNNKWFNAAGINDINLTGTPNQFGFNSANPGAIVNTGNLSVPSGSSLNLIGGTVINTGTLSASGGNITIAAVEGGKAVQITPGNSLLSYVLPIGAINSAIGNPVSLPELLTGSPLDSANGIELKNGVVTLVKSQTPLPDRSGLAVVGGNINSASGSSAGKTEIGGKTIALVDPSFDANSTFSEKTAIQLTATDRILFEDLEGKSFKFGDGVNSLTMQTTSSNGVIKFLNPQDSIALIYGKIDVSSNRINLGNLQASSADGTNAAIKIVSDQDMIVGNLTATSGPIELTSKAGNIKAKNIYSNNNLTPTTITAQAGNIEVDSVEAGILGDPAGQDKIILDIFAGGTFQAIGTTANRYQFSLKNASDLVYQFIAEKINSDNKKFGTNEPVKTANDARSAIVSLFDPSFYVLSPVSIYVKLGDVRIRYAGGGGPVNEPVSGVKLQGKNERFEIGPKASLKVGDPYVAFDKSSGKITPARPFTTFLSKPFDIAENTVYNPIVISQGASGTVGAIVKNKQLDGTLSIGVQDQAFGVLPTKPIDPKPIDPTIQKPSTPNISTIDLENRTVQTLAACPDKKTIALTPSEATRSTEPITTPKVTKKNPCVPDNADDEILKILK